MNIEVKRLTEDDAEVFRAIRLEALERHPEAFQATYESAADLPLEIYKERLGQNALFGGFLDGEIRGFVGFRPLSNAKIRHKGILWGMYVQEGARGTGLAVAMVEALVEHARGKVEQILLSVMHDNERARHFYAKTGFEAYGLERRAFKIGERYVDEEFRVRFLAEGPA